MKKYLLALFLTSCSPWYNLKNTNCWKDNACVERYPVTSDVVKLDFDKDYNGQNKSIYVTDKKTGLKYQMVRKAKGVLELKLLNQESEKDFNFLRE